MTELTKQKCIPCEGIGKSFTKKEADEYLKKVPNWNLSENGKMIFREYSLKNFMSVIESINKIAKIAEREGHHPDLHVTNYRELRIELTTHALHGLTENDFILAAKIDVCLFDGVNKCHLQFF